MVSDAWALATLHDFVRSWNARNWAVFGALHSGDVVYETPCLSVRGREAMTYQFQAMVALVPDLRAFDLCMMDNDVLGNRATFGYEQTGQWRADLTYDTDATGLHDEFFKTTTSMTVEFDGRGQVASLFADRQLLPARPIDDWSKARG